MSRLLSICAWEGITLGGGEKATFAYGGHPDGHRYVVPFIHSRLYASIPETCVERGVDLEMLSTRLPADLTVLSGSSSFLAELPRQAIVMPFRVHMIVDARDGWSGVLERMSPREARFGRACMRRGYTLRRATSEEDFSLFYNRYYAPTMALRHGSRARQVSFEEALTAIFADGFLFFLEDHGRRLAGAACAVDAATGDLQYRLVGVEDGDVELWRSKLLRTMNHFILRWACDYGFKNIDLQGAEPFLTKGTLESKRRLGARAILPPGAHRDLRLWLRIEPGCAAVRTFLINNPPIVIDERGVMSVVYFYTDVEGPRLDLPCRAPTGMEERRLHIGAGFLETRHGG